MNRRWNINSLLKRIILLISLIMFFYLVADTMKKENQRKEAEETLNMLGKLSNQDWDEPTINLFREQLDLVEFSNAICEDRNDIDDVQLLVILTAFPNPQTRLIHDLWTYFNLLAIADKANTIFVDKNVRIALTPRSRQSLEKLFTNLQFDNLNELFRCNTFLDVNDYLRKAKVIGNLDQIDNSRMTILSKDTIRYRDIIKYDFSYLLNSYLKLNPDTVKEVREVFLKLAKANENPMLQQVANVRKSFVGIHVSSVEVPISYLKNAIKYLENSFDSSTVFIVICTKETLSFCKSNLTDHNVVIREEKHEHFDFMVLSMCHGNIITDDFGFLAALLNQAPSTISTKKRNTYKVVDGIIDNFPLFYARNATRWKMID